jgi:predicted GNAT superfamily acetyltransferase
LNQYGTTTSHLHGGLPTDRCIAEWWVNSKRVEAIINSQSYQREPVVDRIPVPSDIAEIRHRDAKRASEIQQGVSTHFLSAFLRDLAVTGFERTQDSGVYLLGPWQSS